MLNTTCLQTNNLNQTPTYDGHTPISANTFKVNLNRPFLVKGLLLEGQVGMIAGEPNLGKSAIMSCIASHVAMGRDMGDMKVNRAAVLYVAAEDPEGILERAYPFMKSAPEGAAAFEVLDKVPDLTDPRQVEMFVSFAQKFQHFHDSERLLIVFDTLNLSIGDADENSARDMSKVFKHAQFIAKTTGAHVLFIHHVPVEATQQQREALTHAFAERLSKGVAGYVAAIHDQHGNDINNPHAHLVFFDVQQKSGGRGRPKSTLGMAKKHAIENTASMWADLHNEMMRTWGFGTESMITHQSFADRGIDRVPTIHEGASARATPHATKARKPKWQRIDQGYTRTEANRVIREINKLKREQEDAEPVRLGTSNGDDKAKRSGSFIEQRECGGWNGQAFGGDRPPFIGPCYPDESCEPVGRATKPTDSPFKSRPRPRSGSQPRFPPLGLLGVAHPVRRRRGIRRIYRELIMLRDRLRVRRLPYERQRSLYAEDTVQEMQQRPPITPLLAETKKLHRDGADRF